MVKIFVHQNFPEALLAAKTAETKNAPAIDGIPGGETPVTRCISCIRYQKGNRISLKLSLRSHSSE